MKIVQIAPPWFPVPPIGYGGIERVIYDLTEGLINAGCEVFLCAPPGSRNSAQIIESSQRPVGLNLTEPQKRRHMVESSRAAFRAALELGVDLIHDHTDYVPQQGFPLPVIRTIHGPAANASIETYRKMTRRGNRLVAIGQRQRELFLAGAEARYGPGEHLAIPDVVYNPLDVTAAPFYPADQKRGYVAFLGRCHWEKSPDGAIGVAQASGVPLMMALRVASEEQAYFDTVVKPLIYSTKNLAKFVGEVSGEEKDDLIGHASAVLFPSPWEEPFGLVVSEAAARGTPVVALARGSGPELIIHGVTGVLCRDEEEMARSIPAGIALDPEACRRHAKELFDRGRIAEQYLAVYRRVLAERAAPSRSRARRPTRHDDIAVTTTHSRSAGVPRDVDRPLVGLG